MGICPQKFGPYFWGSLHLACLYASDASALLTFIQSFTEVLPCPACRHHFSEVLALVPPPKEGPPLTYFKWSVDVHNIVSERIGKEPVSFERAFELWSTCEDAPKRLDLPLWVFVMALIALGVVCFIRNRR